jgi:ketol-acid reductoisomerase
MKKILEEIVNGQFAKEFIAEMTGGRKNFDALYQKDYNHPVEEVGRRLRRMMKWINAKEV